MSHRVPPPAGGGRKSKPVFSGDMCLGKHPAQGKWGDNSEGIKPYFPCVPQKVLGLFGKAHDGWLVTPHNPPLSLGFPTTRNKFGRASPALGFALRSSPSEGRRGSDASFLPSDSGQNRVALPPWVLSLTSVHPACSRRLRRFLRCHASPAQDARLPSDSG